ncbi:unnamed protein product [Rotaria sordida]|uniref:Uncharacterized protein n=1 Tax=Rotaria sordida TaxID=392033 RepID=A0A813TJK7_9BILA|nr:unnamed protein product [Rotaria sordida]CAF0863168.1 unnamed protein product [Rotaria sordida]CAF1008473.1 unnamed protein product [Rotaria sordida]CAF3493480.1 unnamed protein product [Rotaria sordida]CAF3581875.1 unnamed protein product [Rotaria sordida]
MPSTGGVVDSAIVSMKPIDVIPTSRQPSAGITTTTTTLIDDGEIFKALHDCMKDVGKFRQYIYYIGTSCDTTKLRNKIQKLKERINRNLYHQRELVRKAAAAATTSIKRELAMNRFEKCLCFTLASINYYENLLHKFSILLVYFPIATGDRTNVVNLGFEDSTINADEVSYENHEAEENETNRYIELLNQIQVLQLLRDEIEKIDVYQLRSQATSYSKEFVENMHKYTNEITIENTSRRYQENRYSLRDYLGEESSTSAGRCYQQCNRRKFLCTLTIVLLILVIVAVIVTVIVTTNKASTGGQ